ncbi:MAG: dipeptidyl aminopeptidase/acylaminoacyl peptidase [Bacteroidia bacterium]|jgi:dipeptidyl aminopeptidase/acylaminoacyl peptidase
MKCMKTSFAFIIVLISLNSCQVNKEPELDVPTIPIVDFFRNPEKSGYSISPDGTHFAFMSPVKQRMNVFVQKIGSENSKQITFETSRSIADFFWKGNNHIMYLKDVGGDENYALYGTKIDSGSVRAYTQFDKVMTQIIDRLKDDANHIILGLNKRDSRVFDAYRLNINTGDLLLIAENPGSISGWMTDHEGKLRLATVTDGVNTSILYRKTELDVWDTVITTDFKESFNPQFFDFHDTAVVYGVSNIGRDKMALVRFDMSTGKEVEELYKNDNYDITGAAFSHKRKVLTSVFWIGEKAERSGFDPAIEQIYTQLQTELPGMEVYLTSRNEAENLYMVRTMNDRTRGSYYTYTVATKSLQKVADISPWLNPNVLSEMKPITYKSRDGLTIHGYLTLPIGVKAENLPVIINPHGGPWARDVWGFNPEVQFLANRGYAVLQMNFRGSTSYGRSFWEASFKQWGQNMQNDISDGVRYLVKEGIADQNRIGIYGASYGGYATLAGVTLTPDLYACAVDYVGVSNLFSFMETIPPYWSQYKAMMYEMVGDPVDDKEMLARYSPVLHVDQIKTPLFIAQGANDQRVKQAESDQMVEALKSRGIDVQYMLKENEGHGFSNEENKFEFYETMESFLAKYLRPGFKE